MANETERTQNEPPRNESGLVRALGSVDALFVGFVYSELVSAMPFAGGEHNYLLRGMGPI